MVNTNVRHQKRKRGDEHDGGRYVKKPPNAFMLFMKEQRPKYVAAMKDSGTAGVNKILGEKWKSLSAKEQEKYYEEAHREKLLHAQQHPDWSTSINYGRMRKRDRSKASKTEGWIDEEDPSPLRMVSVIRTYSGGTVASRTPSSVMKPSTLMESNLLAGDKDISMEEPLETCPPPAPLTQSPISMFEFDMGFYRAGASTPLDSPAALDESQRAECSHLAGVGHPHVAEEFSLVETVEPLPHHPQQPIPEAAESLTTEHQHFAAVEDLMELLPIYEADQHLPSDSVFFPWLEDWKSSTALLLERVPLQ